MRHLVLVVGHLRIFLDVKLSPFFVSESLLLLVSVPQFLKGTLSSWTYISCRVVVVFEPVHIMSAIQLLLRVWYILITYSCNTLKAWNYNLVPLIIGPMPQPLLSVDNISRLFVHDVVPVVSQWVPDVDQKWSHVIITGGFQASESTHTGFVFSIKGPRFSFIPFIFSTNNSYHKHSITYSLSS